MNLSVKDAAELMDVSDKTIYRWLKENRLPALKIGEQYRFNRAELLEWAMAQRIHVSPRMFAEPGESTKPMPGLAEAIKAGGVHYRVGGTDKAAVLRAAIDVMPLPEEVDKNYLLEVLEARESLGSTGIGDGIAVPHVRNPIVMHIPRPMMAVCFLEHSVDFGALDGQPVHTLFTIISPTISAHLNLLSRLSFGLRHPTFAAAIAARGTREAILVEAAVLDSSVPPKTGSQKEATA